MSEEVMEDPLVQAWRQIIAGADKSWVLFKHGTCVILVEPEDDLAGQATALLREWGPAVAGTPFGDFSVIELIDYPGWVVTCHHPDILTYVAPEEPDDDAPAADADESSDPPDLMVGLIGRAMRDADAQELVVVHVEDQRPLR